MKKTTKKLQLHRLTITNLTASALEHVIGGASIQSVKVDTKIEPCQEPPPPADLRTSTPV
jgi:hypothetical protein